MCICKYTVPVPPRTYTLQFGQRIATLLESMPSGTQPLRNPQAWLTPQFPESWPQIMDGFWDLIPQKNTITNHARQATCGASIPTLIAAMSQSDLWALADMDSVVQYLLSNRHLQLPTDFRNVLIQGVTQS